MKIVAKVKARKANQEKQTSSNECCVHIKNASVKRRLRNLRAAMTIGKDFPNIIKNSYQNYLQTDHIIN